MTRHVDNLHYTGDRGVDWSLVTDTSIVCVYNHIHTFARALWFSLSVSG